MFEFVLWVLFGTLCGWIGYLASRSGEDHAKPYLIVGTLAAVLGGYSARSLSGTEGLYAINFNSLAIAFMTSAICMIIFGCLDKSKQHH